MGGRKMKTPIQKQGDSQGSNLRPHGYGCSSDSFSLRYNGNSR